MPDTPQQLDQISLKLGELMAYTHDFRHEAKNLSAKMDGLSLDVAKQIAALEAKLTVRMEESHASLGGRISVLESERLQRQGATNLATIILKSPTLGWIVGAATTAWAILTGKVHL